MDEDLTIINTNTRNQKIKDFFNKNKKLIISFLGILLLIIIGFYSYQIYKEGHREWLSNKYNNAIIKHKNGNNSIIVPELKAVIEDKDGTYSPLALYYLIDNNLIDNRDEINGLFDILIEKTSLETEIKNLIIYKKGLYNADNSNESQLLEILNPLINSKSVWKSHALYLLAEYFYFKDEKQKSKEFFNQILNTENANLDIVKETQKRLNRDLSE
ncbi:hypothetical protein OAW65_01480 [Candidatus Pelagibacter sp.]|jgi:hypothetical protein|nr:hypothetical protein [Candidatus Pelagibacter sp.]|tara:strand:- start:389 stop:1033 length:645 start_codon:yes stop_codon:yes gene_type:complete